VQGERVQRHLQRLHAIPGQGGVGDAACHGAGPGDARAPGGGGPDVITRGNECECGRQGLTLVLFSAQPEPLLITNTTETNQRIPQEVLTSSRKVDEWAGASTRPLLSSI
jgi:hypothetical protein